MKEINVVNVYNLVNSKGKHLQLRLGMMDLEPQDKYYGDTGYRWSFLGREIPMPVRNGTWFNGFPADTMIMWLAEQGWYVVTEVNMETGKAKVCGLPEPEEAYTDEQFAEDEQVFKCIIRDLLCTNEYDKAIQLCRYAHEVGTKSATELVHYIGTE